MLLKDKDVAVLGVIINIHELSLDQKGTRSTSAVEKIYD